MQALNIEINEKKNLQSELRILHQKLRAVEVQSKLFEVLLIVIFIIHHNKCWRTLVSGDELDLVSNRIL